MEAAYTPTQGQYLAFIYYYTKIHGVPPAESDFQRHFKTSPQSIHQMIVTLDKRGFIERTLGVWRSTRLGRSRVPRPATGFVVTAANLASGTLGLWSPTR